MGFFGGDGVVRRRTVTLTNAQIKALPSTPIECIAAEGENTIIDFLDSRWLLNATGGAYTGIGVTSSLEFRLDIWGQCNPFNEVDQGAFADASKIHLLRVPPPTSNASGGQGIWYGDLPDVVNVPLLLHWNNDGATDLTGGDDANSLVIVIYYTILNV